MDLIKDKDGDFVCPTCEGFKFVRIGDENDETVEGDELEEEENTLAQALEDARDGNALKDYVIDYILDDYKSDEDIKTFFGDLFSYGCASGMIGSLIYYSDTHKFYDEYYDEIEELREEYESEIGEPLKVEGDLKNFYAWFGFQETAWRLANEVQN
jgi:uncharacterized Zn finger protein (UPF0148 family)